MRHISGITQYLSFHVWFISLSITFSGFIHMIAWVRNAFLFKGWVIFHYLFIHSSDDMMGCSHLLSTVHNAAVNTGVQVSVWVSAFNSFEYIPRSKNAGLYGNSMFKFLRTPHCFPKGCIFGLWRLYLFRQTYEMWDGLTHRTLTSPPFGLYNVELQTHHWPKAWPTGSLSPKQKEKMQKHGASKAQKKKPF